MAETKGLGLRGKLHQSWGWLLALGVVLILFGFLILSTPMGVVTASLTTEMWIAAALVAVGVLSPLDLPAVDEANFLGYVLYSLWLITFGVVLLVRERRVARAPADAGRGVARSPDAS